jgi:hypothetical protein
MIALIFLLILLVLFSVRALSFLLRYFRLRTNGVQSFGTVVAFEASKHIMSKNSLQPKIEVRDIQNRPEVEKPISSWFSELNSLKLHQEVVVFQDKLNPKSFVIKGKAELTANALVIILTAGFLIWFIAKTF